MKGKTTIYSVKALTANTLKELLIQEQVLEHLKQKDSTPGVDALIIKIKRNISTLTEIGSQIKDTESLDQQNQVIAAIALAQRDRGIRQTEQQAAANIPTEQAPKIVNEGLLSRFINFLGAMLASPFTAMVALGSLIGSAFRTSKPIDKGPSEDLNTQQISKAGGNYAEVIIKINETIAEAYTFGQIHLPLDLKPHKLSFSKRGARNEIKRRTLGSPI